MTALNFWSRSHDAGARYDVLAHAAARLGELHDVTPRRHRHPFIAGSQFFSMFDHVMHTSFFTRARRIPARLPAIFWFYSHRPSTS